VIDFSPAHSRLGVNLGTNLVLTFQEAVVAGSGNLVVTKIAADTCALSTAAEDIVEIAIDSSQISTNGLVWTVDIPGDLLPMTQYAVTVAEGVVTAPPEPAPPPAPAGGGRRSLLQSDGGGVEGSGPTPFGGIAEGVCLQKNTNAELLLYIFYSKFKHNRHIYKSRIHYLLMYYISF